jgi:hypothetical protein
MTRSKSENQIKSNRVIVKKYQKSSIANSVDEDDDDDDDDDDVGGDDSDNDCIASNKSLNPRSKSSILRKTNESKQSKRISFKGKYIS